MSPPIRTLIIPNNDGKKRRSTKTTTNQEEDQDYNQEQNQHEQQQYHNDNNDSTGDSNMMTIVTKMSDITEAAVPIVATTKNEHDISKNSGIINNIPNDNIIKQTKISSSNNDHHHHHSRNHSLSSSQKNQKIQQQQQQHDMTIGNYKKCETFSTSSIDVDDNNDDDNINNNADIMNQSNVNKEKQIFMYRCCFRWLAITIFVCLVSLFIIGILTVSGVIDPSMSSLHSDDDTNNDVATTNTNKKQQSQQQQQNIVNDNDTYYFSPTPAVNSNRDMNDFPTNTPISRLDYFKNMENQRTMMTTSMPPSSLIYELTLEPTTKSTSESPTSVIKVSTITPTSSLPTSVSPTTQQPSISISASPTLVMNQTVDVETNTIFYAIGDVPYSDMEAYELIGMIQGIPDDAEFVIHVGDIRNSKGRPTCIESEYTSVANTLRLSKAPVFVIMGDNDWNDCPNDDEGLMYWQQSFRGFDHKYWNHTLNVSYQTGRPDNFAFIHKTTLFIGLNLVGGQPKNSTEWNNRLISESQWVIDNIENLLTVSQPLIPRVVIFGHADPQSHHEVFFEPIRNYIQYSLQDSVPILYLCGDGHYWLHETSYMDRPTLSRIMVRGLTANPPLKVIVNSNGINDPYAFRYDRMLPLNYADNTTTISNDNDDVYQELDDAYTKIDDDEINLNTTASVNSTNTTTSVNSTNTTTPIDFRQRRQQRHLRNYRGVDFFW